MSARVHSRQRYRQIPVYEFKGFKIRVYRVKERFSAQFRGPDNSRERFEKATELDAVDAAKERIRQLTDPEIQQKLLEEKAVAELLAPLKISLIEAVRMVVTSVERLRPFNIGIPQAIDYFVGSHTAMDSVEKPKAGKPQKNIFTPEELVALIKAGLAIYSRALAALLIQAMTGVRSEELRQTDPRKDRLRWSDIRLDQPLPEIHVRDNVSKTGEERFVPIPPALVKWLRFLRLPGDEPVYTEFNLFGDYRQIAKKAGLRWKKNGLRKSFNTYDAALTGSFHLTSKAAGNSAPMVRRYYNKPTSQAGLVALQWFGIGPKKYGAIVRKYAARIKKERLHK